jgi:uncharacterized membrane protein
MKLQTFRKAQAVTSVILALLFSAAIVNNNFLVPAIALVAGTVILLIMRSRVKEVIVDERDLATVGQAAMHAIRIFSWLAVVAMLIFYSVRSLNPAYEPIAVTLAFSAGILMVLYSIIFKYYNRFKWSERKWPFILTSALVLAIVAVFAIRAFSDEDGWVCSGGQWVRHGNPSSPAPTAACYEK